MEKDAPEGEGLIPSQKGLKALRVASIFLCRRRKSALFAVTGAGALSLSLRTPRGGEESLRLLRRRKDDLAVT